MSGLVLLGCLTAISGCKERSAHPELAIGLLADLPTPGGRPTVEAAQLAIAEINEGGGVTIADRRYRLRLIVRDSENNPTSAVEAAREMIFQGHILALVGPNVSRNAIPVAELAQSAGVPMLSPGSTNPRTTAGKEHAFRMATLDNVQGEVMAEFAIEQLRAQRAAVLFDVANPSDESVSDAFSKTFHEHGGQVVSRQTYVTGARDFDAQLLAIAEATIDVLFLPNQSADVAKQAERARALGIDAVLLGSDDWSPHVLEKTAALQGAYFSHHWHASLAENEPASQAFVDAYRARYGQPPAVMAALTYDAVKILAQALERADSARPAAVRDALATVPPYDGITGRSSFDSDGNPAKTALILHFQAGQTRFYMRLPRVARSD